MRVGLVVVLLTGCRQLLGIDDSVVIGIDSAQPADQAADQVVDQAPDPAACGSEFTFAHGGHVYFVSPNFNEIWQSAKTSCEGRGGYLAVPDDEAEVAFWAAEIGGIRWIGVRKVTGQWETVLGQPFSDTSPLWTTGEPRVGVDVAKVIEADVAIGTDDSANNFDASYICECP